MVAGESLGREARSEHLKVMKLVILGWVDYRKGKKESVENRRIL